MLKESISPQNQAILKATSEVSAHLFADLKPEEREQKWDLLMKTHFSVADKIAELRVAIDTGVDIKARYPHVRVIAEQLIMSYPDEYGVKNLLTNIVFTRIGRAEIQTQQLPGQWTLGHNVVKEYLQVRAEMGKGRDRVRVDMEDVVKSVLSGKVPLTRIPRR